MTELPPIEINEETFLREALEVAVAARAAKLRTDEQLAKLQRNIRMQTMVVEDNDLIEFHRYDEEFHALLVDCTGFENLSSTIESLSLQVQRARQLLLDAADNAQLPKNERVVALSAIAYQWRDEESLKIMQRYAKSKDEDLAKMAQNETRMLNRWIAKRQKKN